MASGDTLLVFSPQHNQAPSSNPATFDTRNNHLVLDFDAGTDENAIFPGVMPQNYGAGGVDVRIFWMATTATSGNVIWNASWEEHADDAFDLDADGFAAANAAAADAAPSASGEGTWTTITFTDGADMDSVGAGDSFRLRITRDADNGSDTMAGDAEVLRVEVQES